MSAPSVEFQPDYAMAAGEYLAALLPTLDMTQSDLAARTGLSPKHVNQIIKHRAAISAMTAAQLEFATGVPAEIWAGLDARHQTHNARALAATRLSGSLDWLKRFNLSELVKRGIVPAPSPSVEVAESILRYFGISEPDGWNRVWQPSLTSFRRSPSFSPDATATTLWLRAGQRLASRMKTQPFDERLLRGSLEDLRKLTTSAPDEALPKLQTAMAGLGVALVYVSEFDGCRASGATWWATPNKAVIMLSNRGKREDRFWFSFFHEVGHVLLHAKRETFLDQNRADSDGDEPPWETSAPASGFIDDGSRDSEIERQADDFAADTLIPPGHRRMIRTLSSDREIIALAAAIGVSPGIVAGRYQFETNQFQKFNDLRRPIAQQLFDQAI